ncbi:hypothetical protein [Mucilaginibacter sp. SP1R1]|uniref:hypothetical protein n=1 Tax=Mucilaginibacter sp. SP1R1 TaxID=2723091 RepID=UPI00161F98D1|nr:hypothetical protein [Mucilaginibacter sp. SP1R1]MBB6150040.1 NADH:ubiquinone oxidoreductase subunit 3 (subunit A) [Mucilaginibacter sp. SP1R1]
MPSQPAENPGTENIFIRYRKVLSVFCIILLLFIPFEVYTAPAFNDAHKFQAIGYWVNTAITFLCVPVGLLIYMRKQSAAKGSAIDDQDR